MLASNSVSKLVSLSPLGFSLRTPGRSGLSSCTKKAASVKRGFFGGIFAGVPSGCDQGTCAVYLIRIFRSTKIFKATGKTTASVPWLRRLPLQSV